MPKRRNKGPWFVQKRGVEYPSGLYSYHQDWVEALARAAEAKAANTTLRSNGR